MRANFAEIDPDQNTLYGHKWAPNQCPLYTRLSDRMYAAVFTVSYLCYVRRGVTCSAELWTGDGGTVLEEGKSGATALGKKRLLLDQRHGKKRHKATAEFSVLLIYTTLEPTVWCKVFPLNNFKKHCSLKNYKNFNIQNIQEMTIQGSVNIS